MDFTSKSFLFGHEANLSIHFHVGLPAQARPKLSPYSYYLLNLNDKFCKIYWLVRKHLEANAKRQKRDFDTRIVFHSYSVGDIVYPLEVVKLMGKVLN